MAEFKHEEKGAQMWAVSHGRLVSHKHLTVERVTPTGIMVLNSGTRLNPSTNESRRYHERGADFWDNRTYFPADHPYLVVVFAQAALSASATKVRTAAEMVARDPLDPDAAGAMVEAAQAHRRNTERYHSGARSREVLARAYAIANDLDWDPPVRDTDETDETESTTPAKED